MARGYYYVAITYSRTLVFADDGRVRKQTLERLSFVSIQANVLVEVGF
jgi:hypothetical protein